MFFFHFKIKFYLITAFCFSANVLKGLFDNWLFVFILVGSAIVQILMVQYGSHALHVHEGGLSFEHWVVCVGLGAMSLPVQQVINLLVTVNPMFS